MDSRLEELFGDTTDRRLCLSRLIVTTRLAAKCQLIGL